MASVFLSYAREDAVIAKALAAALQQAGHEVWWDRQIHGGAEYSGAIQAALNSAQVVLVLWSRASIGSEWVRDEAAEGRDSGRLLPVVLDDCKPPLGFRQRQSIDMAGWSGRGPPPNFGNLLGALSAMSASVVSSTIDPTVTEPKLTSLFARRVVVVGFLAAGAVGATGL